MIGITAYGGYVPYNRLQFKTIAGEYDKKAEEGERAVAYYDEDSITMAVAASLAGIVPGYAKHLDAVYFATTTSPYAEKQGATNIAAALDARHDIRTGDFGNSLRASSTAMLTAIDDAKLGRNALVAIGDTRRGGADGGNESALGDGGAAFVFGNENVIAEVLATYTVSLDFIDVWRSTGDAIIRNWDVRYAISEGYESCVNKAVEGILKATNLGVADFSKIVLYAHEERHIYAVAKKLGFKPNQIQNPMYNRIGNTGCAAAPLMLALALECAEPGDKILYISYGEGCDAIAFEVTKEITGYTLNPTVSEYIEHKSSDMTYGKYLKWKGLTEFEPQKRPEQERSALPDYFRNYKKNYALYGSRCTHCGTPQFPPQRVCAKCKSIDTIEEYRFYGKDAWIKTFTLDRLSLSPDPPNYLVVVEFEGGGKMMTYLVDCRREDLHVNMKVTLTYRKLFKANGVHTYFWKAAPRLKGK